MHKYLDFVKSNKMKDISGIDENGNPKNGPFDLFFTNGLISCQGEFKHGKNQDYGNTF